MAHPELDELQRFVSGQLDDESTERIAVHLENCMGCTNCLDRLTDDDPLVKELNRCGPLPEKLSDKLQQGKCLGPYRLQEELGRGGMGIVYRAYDTRLKRDVALKIIASGEYADPEQRMRLRQEAETMAALQHPGIVQIYDVGEEDDTMYIALELLHAGGLAAITGNQPHSPRWYAALLKQLAETLHYAHQAGFVHRDLKPENILLAPSDDFLQPWARLEISDDTRVPPLKITDFGLSKSLEENNQLTRTGVMLGTLGYMAPEQMPDNPEAVTAATDIYALGVILYELLTGQSPLHADSITLQLNRLRNDDPLAPRHFNAKIPKDLETICLTCLMKKPTQRYPSAQALAQDLTRFLDNEPIVARPLSLWQKLFRRARREPVAATFVSGAVMVYLLHTLLLLQPTQAHRLALHWHMTVLVLIWVLATYAIQQVYQHRRWQNLGEYLYAALPPILLSLAFFIPLASGASPPVVFYFLNIPAAVLISARPKMIWFETVLTVISYLFFLVALQHWWPNVPLSGGHPPAVILALLLMGFFMHLIIRRSLPTT